MGRRTDDGSDAGQTDLDHDQFPNPRREDSASAVSADASPDAPTKASSDEPRLRTEQAAEADDGST